MGNRTQVNRAMLRLRAFPRNLRRRPLVESFVATFVGFQSFRQRFRQRFHFGRLLGQAPLICWGVLALAGALPLPCLAQADRTAEITRCLEQLQSADPHERSLAKLLLVRPPNLVQLEPFKDRLLTILGTNLDSEESAVILGRLTLPKEIAEKLLLWRGTPDKVRARLGDRAALGRVIQRFQQAKSVAEIRKYGSDLLYVGSTEAMQGFAAELGSEQVLTDVHGNRLSKLLLLLSAYGEFHPAEPLFTLETLLQHSNVTPEQFKVDEHQRFLRQVEQHFKAAHKLDVTLRAPILMDAGHRGVLPRKQL